MKRQLNFVNIVKSEIVRSPTKHWTFVKHPISMICSRVTNKLQGTTIVRNAMCLFYSKPNLFIIDRITPFWVVDEPLIVWRRETSGLGGISCVM